MGKIRPLLLQWELHIQKEYRKGNNRKRKTESVANIFWPSINSMENHRLSVIHRQDYWKKFMGKHLRLQSKSDYRIMPYYCTV